MVAPEAAKCTPSACAEVSRIQLGYRLRRKSLAGETAAVTGLEVTMTATTLPRTAGVAARSAALYGDLVDEILKVGPQAAAGLADEKF
jgi:hypothetical protein